MKVLVEELRQLCMDILGNQGLNEDDARIVSDVVLEAELRGRPSHGVIRVPGIAERVASKGRTSMRVARTRGFVRS